MSEIKVLVITQVNITAMLELFRIILEELPTS